MKLSKPQIIFGSVLVVATAAALWGISAGDREQPPTVEDDATTPPDTEMQISWNEDAITDNQGKVLLTSDDVPGSMSVSEEAEFGAAGPFTGAALSPYSKWIAFTTGGAAHDGGWLYEIATEEISPVAFQYGGGVDVLEWSPNSRFVAFAAESPAPTTHILVVDRNDIDGYVSDIGQQIEVEAQAETDPPFVYEFLRWDAPQTLCYAFEDQAESCVDVAELFAGADPSSPG